MSQVALCLIITKLWSEAKSAISFDEPLAFWTISQPHTAPAAHQSGVKKSPAFQYPRDCRKDVDW